MNFELRPTDQGGRRGNLARQLHLLMNWAISTWSRDPCNPSTTRLGHGCHLRLRYVLLPMSPVCTLKIWCRRRDPRPTHYERVTRSKYRGKSRGDWAHLGPDDGSKSPILLGFGAAGEIRLGPVSGQSPEAERREPARLIPEASIRPSSKSKIDGATLLRTRVCLRVRGRHKTTGQAPSFSWFLWCRGRPLLSTGIKAGTSSGQYLASSFWQRSGM